MISLKDAVEIAEANKFKIGGPDEGDSVIIASVKYFRRGWIFGFNSLRYLDTRDDNHYLLGGYSLYISMDSGEVIKIPSAFGPENYVEDLYGKKRG